MTTQTIIRLGQEQDLEAVFSLIKEFAGFQGAPQKVINTVEQMRNEQHLFNCFVAQDIRCQVIGFTSFFFCYYSWSGKAIYMDDIYVQPAYRGQGIGKRLLRAVLEHGQAHNCYKLRWQVSSWDTHAIQFYKALGAKIDEIEINCDLVIG